MKKTMIDVLRTIASRTLALPKNWFANRFEQAPRPASDALAAWSEFMGNDSAELWIAARRENLRQ